MYLFWEKGYDATSIKDIVAVTGLKPGSLYNLYGNKEGIFEAVIDKYTTNSLAHIQEILQKDDNALKNIETFLKDVILAGISNETTNGCLLVKTLLVLPHKDIKLQKHITNFFNKIEKLLSKTLSRAKVKGEITSDATLLANLIIVNIFGLHAHYKSYKNIKIVEESIYALIACIKSS